MTARTARRRVWRAVAAGCGLILAITSLAGATVASRVTRPAGGTVQVLQLNLCDSGIARCYTGRSVRAAAELIRAEGPDIVTLNEVCRDDVSLLERTLSDTKRGGIVASAFEAAVDRRTAKAFRCRNGQPYGIGVLARVRLPDDGHRTYVGVYPIQDTRDPEERVWLCVRTGADFYACTTHLASTSGAVAFAQCGYLFATVIPAVRGPGGPDRLVLGGDFNLSSGGSPDARSCLPSGYARADDGGVQHIVAGTGFTVRSSRSISMHGTTDHPGLLVELTGAEPRT